MNSNRENLINKISYRARYRGTKEMDIFVSAFVKLIVSKLNFDELPSGMIQKSSGKIFRSSDWRPDHLKIIYEQYQDKIVDLTISKEISGRIPKLISVI